MVKIWGWLLTPWSRILEKLTGSAVSQEIPRILWNLKFYYYTRNCPPPVPIRRQPRPTSWRSVLILSPHLCLGLPNGLLPSGFPTRTLCTPLPSPIHATSPTHLIHLEKYEVTGCKIPRENRRYKYRSAVSFVILEVSSIMFMNENSVLETSNNVYVLDIIYQTHVSTFTFLPCSVPICENLV